MTPKHEAHLAHLLKLGGELLDQKYRAGNAKHGGFLPTKPDLIDEAIHEALDQFVYLDTLRDQISAQRCELVRLKGERAVMLQRLTKAISSKDWALVAQATMGAVEGELHESKPAVHF